MVDAEHRKRLRLFINDLLLFSIVVVLLGICQMGSSPVLDVRSPKICLAVFLLFAAWFLTFTPMNVIRSLLVISDVITNRFEEKEAVFKQQIWKMPGLFWKSEYMDQNKKRRITDHRFYEIIAQTGDGYLFCTAAEQLPLKSRTRYTFVVGTRSHAVIDVLDEQGDSIWPVSAD